jgi:hypothetical protein
VSLFSEEVCLLEQAYIRDDKMKPVEESAAMVKDVLHDLEKKMKTSLEHFRKELSRSTRSAAGRSSRRSRRRSRTRRRPSGISAARPGVQRFDSAGAGVITWDQSTENSTRRSSWTKTSPSPSTGKPSG